MNPGLACATPRKRMRPLGVSERLLIRVLIQSREPWCTFVATPSDGVGERTHQLVKGAGCAAYGVHKRGACFERGSIWNQGVHGVGGRPLQRKLSTGNSPCLLRAVWCSKVQPGRRRSSQGWGAA